MIVEDEGRDALIERMLRARTVEDAEAANVSADAWLKENPGDPRVLAAQERLDEKGARMRDPERGTDRVTLVVYACAFLLAAVSVLVLTGSFYAAGFAGLISAFGFPWEAVEEAIAERRRGAESSGYENGER